MQALRAEAAKHGAAASSCKPCLGSCACTCVQAARSELQFSLLVPGRGSVSGALRYYPFENERETLPDEAADAAREPLTTFTLTQQPSQALTGATQAPDGARLPLPLQAPHDPQAVWVTHSMLTSGRLGSGSEGWSLHGGIHRK